MVKADWIAVATDHRWLWAWAMGPEGGVLARAHSDIETNGCSGGEVEAALLRMVEPWLSTRRTRVLVCGPMICARPAPCEAAIPVPCKPLQAVPVAVASQDMRLDLHVLPGMRQDSPADLLLGEAVQVSGAISESPQFDGVLCLAGLHTKWVHVSAEEIVSFRTAMTGELFELLSKTSSLQEAVAGHDLDLDVFDSAVSECLSRPERLAQSLFNIRAETLLNGQDKAAARARLSGLLIGADLAAARPYWLGQQVLVSGPPTLAKLYDRALHAQGTQCLAKEVEALILAGFRQAHDRLAER